METHMPPPLALSKSQFEVFYHPLSEPVFLICQASKSLAAANRAFRNLAAVGEEQSWPLPALQYLPADVLLRLKPGAEVATTLQLPDNTCLPVSLNILPVMVEGVALLLCIAKMLPAEPDAPTTEKQLAIKEVYHRAKNTLNIIVSLLGLQLGREKDARVRHLLQQSKSRIYALALLQEHQYHSDRLSEIKANDFLITLAQAVINTFRNQEQHLKLVPVVEVCWLPIDKLVPLALIAHELVANAVQHAFDPGQEGEIKLSLHGETAQRWQLLIEDNGKGMPETHLFLQYNTLGAQLVKGLAKQLKAQVQVSPSSGGGTTVRLYFSTQQPP